MTSDLVARHDETPVVEGAEGGSVDSWSMGSSCDSPRGDARRVCWRLPEGCLVCLLLIV